MMTDEMEGKHVLLVAPRFFGYEGEILDELRRRGAIVDFLPDRPFNSPAMKALTRLRREWIFPVTDKFFLNSIEKFDRGNYDLIFVVVGESLSVSVLSSLRSSFPRARFVFYMWDAMRNRRKLEQNLSLFDACHTFDPDDSSEFGMKFRPLFFSPGFEHEYDPEFQYHLSFVGTAHSDRHKIVSEITTLLPTGIRYYWYLYLQARWVFFAHKFGNPEFRKARISDFRFSPLSKTELHRIFFSSLAVLDIEHPRQTGLTMRTFETMGANKKLVTTNKNVRNYDFFDDRNILVVDRKNIQSIPTDFLENPYAPLDVATYRKYSISGWLDDILTPALGKYAER